MTAPTDLSELYFDPSLLPQPSSLVENYMNFPYEDERIVPPGKNRLRHQRSTGIYFEYISVHPYNNSFATEPIKQISFYAVLRQFFAAGGCFGSRSEMVRITERLFGEEKHYTINPELLPDGRKELSDWKMHNVGTVEAFRRAITSWENFSQQAPVYLDAEAWLSRNKIGLQYSFADTPFFYPLNAIDIEKLVKGDADSLRAASVMARHCAELWRYATDQVDTKATLNTSLRVSQNIEETEVKNPVKIAQDSALHKLLSTVNSISSNAAAGAKVQPAKAISPTIIVKEKV